MAFWFNLGWNYNGDGIFAQSSWSANHEGTLTVPVLTGGSVSVPAKAETTTECGPSDTGEWVCQTVWELAAGPKFRLGGSGSHYEGLGFAMEPKEFTLASKQGNFFDAEGNNISNTTSALDEDTTTFSQGSETISYPYVTSEFDKISESEWRMQLNVAWYSQQGRSLESAVYPIVDVISSPVESPGVLSGSPLGGIWLDRSGQQSTWVDNTSISEKIRWIIVYVS